MASKRSHEETEKAHLPISLVSQSLDAITDRPKWKRTGRANLIMRDEHKDILMSKRSVLVDNMMMTNNLMDELISKRVLSVDEMQTIVQNDATDSRKVQRFLDIFIRKPDSAFSILVDALNNDSQQHIVNIIEPEMLTEADLNTFSSYHIESEPFSNHLKRNFHRLLELLDLETGVLDDLLSNDIIQERLYNSWYELSAYEKNEKFLNYLIENFQSLNFPTILKILGDCHQSHVVNFISSGGRIDTNSNRERILTEDETKRITANQRALMDLIPADVIVPLLVEQNIITQRHQDAILCRDTKAHQNRKLLEIIKKRSFNDVVKFCQVLESQNFSCLSKAIQGHAVLPIIHAKQDSPSKKLRKEELLVEETQISNEVNEFVKKELTDEDNECHQCCRDRTKLSDRNISIINAAPIGSIAVYLMCETKQALHDVWQLMQTGTLRGYLERILAGERGAKLDLILSVDPEEFCTMFDYAWADDLEMEDSRAPQKASSSLDDLSDKRLDAIDILELVRRKQMSVKEAEYYLRQLCTTGISLEDEPPIYRRCIPRSSSLTSTSLVDWQPSLSNQSFQFSKGNNNPPMFGSS